MKKKAFTWILASIVAAICIAIGIAYILEGMNSESITLLIVFSGIIPTVALGSTAGWFAEWKAKLIIGKVVFSLMAIFSFLLGLNGILNSRIYYQYFGSIVFLAIIPFALIFIIIKNIGITKDKK